MIEFHHHDGGREAAGFRGATGDCAARAVAITSGRPYREVYDRINELSREHERPKGARGRRSNARLGVYRTTMKRLMAELGATWTPTMGIGTGTTVHLRTGEVPATGAHVLSLSRHYCALVDGAVFDTHDPSRGGTRAVYGYWTLPDLPHA